MRATLPPPSAWTSALVAAAVGFGGTIVLVVQALRAMGASVEQAGSAVTALCLAIAVPGALLSLRLRVPVVLAWSTPGAALLVTSPAVPWPVACGAFAAAGLIGVLVGAVPLLGRLAGAIPPAIASAMLAGVLLPFGLRAFKEAGADPLFVLVLAATFVVGRARFPLYALLMVLAVGVALILGQGRVGALPPGATFGTLIPVPVAFDAGALVSIAMPLFVVTLVSQNLPGIAVLRVAGYTPPPRPLLVGTGLASVVAAPFGAHAVNLAAITAAICTSAEADPDKARRWRTGLIYAALYLLLAIFSPLLVRGFVALPPIAIAVLTGLAIIPALLGALEASLAGKEHRDATILTLLVTASGVTVLGIGSAFWGVAAGLGAMGITHLLRGRASA
ncbi:benzoate/H(+) symporter BenE family transporter [Sphingomonas jatrophae]|uniref:Benzoate membrane transport protein n=1 Tax=Sphingomonas jatrophae TaxID=1166337 RepID=A0A1I6KED5_9SPHN|nr:benzoate/H(+) symporter BenE family transporter [Sphingomonas jatrophae]SFR89514.1 benzoate membrane transport protein [Sphingomonas jatrophae]